MEPRGDFRSIFCLFMACPEVLVGYSFSGGGRFLNREPKEMEHIAPLEEHHRRLGECLSLDYRLSDFFLSQKSRVGSAGRKKVGLSFSGSLPLKCLPEEMALDLVSRLAQRGVELIYIAAPHDHFLAVSNAVASGKITIWKGSFSEYFQLISGLDAYVGMDSGGAHLAAMNRIPSLIFYGTQVASYCRPPAYPEQTCWEPVSPLSCRPCPGKICVNGDRYQNCFYLMDRKAVVKSLDRLLGDEA